MAHKWAWQNATWRGVAKEDDVAKEEGVDYGGKMLWHMEECDKGMRVWHMKGCGKSMRVWHEGV